MTTIASAIAAGRRAMNQMEPGIVRSLLAQYGVAWVGIDARLTEVEGWIEAAIARGETVDDAWLRRQLWWQSTLDSIEAEMSRYTQGMARTLATGQQEGVWHATRTASAVGQAIQQEAIRRGITIGGLFPGRINPGAMEQWVSALQPDSPVRKAIDAYGERVSESIRTQMTQGLAAGEHPRTITRKIVAEVGEDVVEGRIQTLARTETHRAFRGAAAESFAAMQENGAIVGYRWKAALGPRTCAACLAMHNRTFEHYPTSQHVACRCTVAPVTNPAIIPARSQGQSGEEWLRKQPAAVQRRVLKSPERYEAFRTGTPLDEFVGTKHDDVWGDAVYVKPMKARAA